jgi:GAF domain-containing protein
MMSFLGGTVVIAGQPLGDQCLIEKTGPEEFSERDQQAVLPLAGFAGVAIDPARRARA